MKRFYTAILSMAILAVLISFFPQKAEASTGEAYHASAYAYQNNSSSSLEYADYLKQFDQNYPQFDETDPRLMFEGENNFEFDAEGGTDTLSVMAVDGINGLSTPERGTVKWTINVPAKGYYQLKLYYYPIAGKSSSIERSLLINGQVPFAGADSFVFYRVWEDQTEIMRDINDNDLKPGQVEKPQWSTAFFKDDIGYETDPYLFYFNVGANTISLSAIKEPLLIDKIQLVSKSDSVSYENYLSELEALHGDLQTKADPIRIEAENADTKSSPTLYPISDRGSMLTTPYDPAKIRLNTIGGTNWKIPGDSITWKFEVTTPGYYYISMRAKQNQVRGMYSSRIIYIDNQIPFDELKDIKFKYQSNWQNVTLGNDAEDYKFYFDAGVHTITMEVTLGEYSQLIKDTEGIIDRLSKVYRDIIRFTSVTPDAGRDYQLTKQIPDMLDRFKACSDDLKRISGEIARISGGKSDKTGMIDAVWIQLDDLIKNHRSIPSRLLQLNNNISSLGNLLMMLRELPLSIDYITVHTADYKMPRANENFFQKLWNGIISFWYSFFNDYSAISKTSGGNEQRNIEVWMTLGRDQANVLRQLIDQYFTPNSPNHVGVDLKLVSGDVLLRATLAGIGPDVAINVDSTLPVNYALRNAVYDISQFSDYNDVVGTNLPYDLKPFDPSALVPFSFNGGVYALPEKQSFLMMFVRDDIVTELGIKVPETWDDIIQIIPDLQANQLQFYLPVNEEGATALNPVFVSMLYQRGGELYINDAKECGLLSEAAMDAFEYWTEFYTLYSFPKSANFINRFRTGEMPMGIAYYDAYNTLSVFAPELRGKWSFHPIPGTLRTKESGETYIDNTATAIGTGVVMLKQPALKSASVRDDSWEFMKWWTSAETQVKFGREMEGILGSAARHNTANKLALEQLAWPVKDYQQLAIQQGRIKAIPQVAGGYITGREVENAFRKVINDLPNARETLYEYVLLINREIERKREEFNLPLA